MRSKLFLVLLPTLLFGCDPADVCDLSPDLCAEDGGDGAGDDSGGEIPCGGIAGFTCPDDLVCVDADDSCDPQNGGADCPGICVPPPASQECLASSQCGAGEFCSFDQGCGEGPIGTCEPIPEICVQVFEPVCGCDGVTYSNDCFAAAAGSSVQYAGACEPASCDEIVGAFLEETTAIRSCTADEECGQVLQGVSCGCSRNWVARLDADASAWGTLLDQANEAGCSVPGAISTCDCPAADGFACSNNTCQWNYVSGPGLPN